MVFFFEALGTRWQIDIPDDQNGDDAIVHEVREFLLAFEKVYSRFRSDSLVADIARTAGTHPFPPDADVLFAVYRTLYDLTGGEFTPLIGQLLVDAGYDPVYSLRKKSELVAPPAWDAVMQYEPSSLTVNRPVQLDFGAAGKGHAVDGVAHILMGRGIHSFTIDAGGDILHKSKSATPLRVGLEHPDDQKKVIGVATITNASMCASAGNRRAWGNFHHIFSPKHQVSVDTVCATWVVAESVLVADALATCLFLTSPEQLLEAFAFEYCVVYSGYTYRVSEQFPAEMFL